MQHVNQDIFRDSPSDKFITSVYLTLHYEQHWVEYVNSGHNPPYLVKDQISTLDESGLMLGIMDPIDFPSARVSMEAGDVLVLFSDGVTEATNPAGELYSEERFEQWLIQHRKLNVEQLKEALLNEIKLFADGAEQSDDITFILLKRLS